MTVLYRRSVTGYYLPQYDFETEPSVLQAPNASAWSTSNTDVFNSSHCSNSSGPGPMNGSFDPFHVNGCNSALIQSVLPGPNVQDQLVEATVTPGSFTVNHGPIGGGVLARYDNNVQHAFYLVGKAANPGVDNSMSWEAGVATFGFGSSTSNTINGSLAGAGKLSLRVTGAYPAIQVDCFYNGSSLGSFTYHPPAHTFDTGTGATCGGMGSFSGGGVFCVNWLTLTGWAFKNWGVGGYNSTEPGTPDHRRGSGYARRGFSIPPINTV